ncbi:PepA aminopeptidase [Moraxella macacae 0408225]|uniref:Probable cytosol aminopeptidase n=1 Tax=Moraxella macacae 0408225 TaxID=1230338 RepID=L2F8V5_9GAMM|nr:leucyl aminopeptidase [Moraxella macacae]ELA09494.1 PepA aminopeptidase [Moraxella macacae 0408225]
MTTKTLKLTLNLGKKNPKKSQKHSCCVYLIDDNKQLLQKNDNAQDSLKNLIQASQIRGKVAETFLHLDLKTAEAILLVGIGSIDKLTGGHLQKIANSIYNALAKTHKSATIYLQDCLDEVQFGQFSLALLNSSYCFDTYKSQKADKPLLSQIDLSVTVNNLTNYEQQLSLQNAIFAGQSLTKDVANEPPNVCFPAFMAKQAHALAKQYPDVLTVKVLGEKDMEKLGMNCFLAVSRGSEKEGKLVLLEYNGLNTTKPTKKTKKAEKLAEPIVLVGKGVTFDTGGISLKPSEGMGEMKFDMGGSASVLGAIKALCEARLPLQVVGALACAENMPSGNATRPGDIVTAMNGTTVEILNTDAEGRLVLCDTLTYVQQYNPSVIIDVATLTGACVIALGNVRTGLFSNDEDVIFELEQASEEAYDRVWHLPLDDDYQEQLNSHFADVQNIGGRAAGSITAGCFLSRFVNDIPWAHLDIAGTAWVSGSKAHSTGRPVPLLLHYLKNKV